MAETPAQALVRDLTSRVEHADVIVCYVKSKNGNHFVLESSNATLTDLIVASEQIKQAELNHQ